jgi:hypothetical protein
MFELKEMYRLYGEMKSTKFDWVGDWGDVLGLLPLYLGLAQDRGKRVPVLLLCESWGREGKLLRCLFVVSGISAILGISFWGKCFCIFVIFALLSRILAVEFFDNDL